MVHTKTPWLILPINTITFPQHDVDQLLQKRKGPFSTAADVVLLPCVTVNVCFCAFPQISRWLGRAVEPCGSHMNDKDEAETSSCTVCVWVCVVAPLPGKPPTGGHQGSCLLIILSHAMNSTTPPPAITDADAAISYVLVPFFFITVIGIVVAVVSLFDTQGQISCDRHDYS